MLLVFRVTVFLSLFPLLVGDHTNCLCFHLEITCDKLFALVNVFLLFQIIIVFEHVIWSSYLPVSTFYFFLPTLLRLWLCYFVWGIRGNLVSDHEGFFLFSLLLFKDLLRFIIFLDSLDHLQLLLCHHLHFAFHGRVHVHILLDLLVTDYIRLIPNNSVLSLECTLLDRDALSPVSCQASIANRRFLSPARFFLFLDNNIGFKLLKIFR